MSFLIASKSNLRIAAKSESSLSSESQPLNARRRIFADSPLDRNVPFWYRCRAEHRSKRRKQNEKVQRIRRGSKLDPVLSSGRWSPRSALTRDKNYSCGLSIALIFEGDELFSGIPLPVELPRSKPRAPVLAYCVRMCAVFPVSTPVKNGAIFDGYSRSQ
jgi:hypothetical protein